MCETGHGDGCTSPDAFLIVTNRIANPGRTPVILAACRDHLPDAMTDQVINNSRLGDQGMPGREGVTVTSLADDTADDIADAATLSRIESSACDR